MDRMRKRFHRLDDEVMPRVCRAGYNDVLAGVEAALAVDELERGGRLPGLEEGAAVEVPALQALRIWGEFHAFSQDAERGRDGLGPVSYTHLTLPTKRIV